MRRSSLLATAALAFFVVGAPMMVVSRLLGGLLPLQAFDFVLAMLVICWIQICAALIRRDDALDSLTQPRFSLRWQADNLVSQSQLGFGLPARQTVRENDLLRVDTPSESIDALLPPAAIFEERASRLGQSLGSLESVQGARRIIPSLAEQPTPEGPEILATEEYVVARGDTFWSIAEYAFGDGRHWQKVQEINLGRQVAPGVVLSDSHEPRIGWSILIPLVESSLENDESNISPL